MRKKLIIVLMSFLAVCAQGATLTVDPNGSADYTTINVANTDDQIILLPRTYADSCNHNIERRDLK